MDKEKENMLSVLKEYLSLVDSKLSIIINLLMKKEEMSIKDKVAMLENVSLSYKDAAKVLGISEQHYSKEKSLLKNNKKETEKEVKTEINKERGEESESETNNEFQGAVDKL